MALDSIPALKGFPSVNSVMEDRRGDIWAARWGALTQTSPDGILKTILTVKDGFYDREIRGIAEDSKGTFGPEIGRDCIVMTLHISGCCDSPLRMGW